MPAAEVTFLAALRSQCVYSNLLTAAGRGASCSISSQLNKLLWFWWMPLPASFAGKSEKHQPQRHAQGAVLFIIVAICRVQLHLQPFRRFSGLCAVLLTKALSACLLLRYVYISIQWKLWLSTLWNWALRDVILKHAEHLEPCEISERCWAFTALGKQLKLLRATYLCVCTPSPALRVQGKNTTHFEYSGKNPWRC